MRSSRSDRMLRSLLTPSADDLFSHPVQWIGKHLALYATAAMVAGTLFVAGAAVYSHFALTPPSLDAQDSPSVPAAPTTGSEEPAVAKNVGPKLQDQPPNLAADEIALVRVLFGLKGTGKESQSKVGDVTHSNFFVPLIPSSITEKVPRLKGF